MQLIDLCAGLQMRLKGARGDCVHLVGENTQLAVSATASVDDGMP